MIAILVQVSVVSLALGLKCRTSIDPGIKWTVDCSSMNLSDAPPPMIIHPVVILNMSNNLLTKLVESQFINWTDILVLDLSDNCIINVDGNTFNGLNSLTELNLQNNNIEVLSQNLTDNLHKLRVLNLFGNKIKLIKPGTFLPIPSLLKLILRGNLDLGLSSENIEALDEALTHGLIKLDLANTSLTNLSDNFFNNASHLISLNLALNPLQNIPVLPPALRYLNISSTLIEELPSGLFLRSDTLQKLSIDNMPLLQEIRANAFRGLVNLDELYINYCPKLNFISSDTFGESSPELKKLTISHNALFTLPKTFKELLAKVEYIDLQGNPWVCDGRISWVIKINISTSLTENLRCSEPRTARGMLMMDYFKPRTLHSYTTLIRAGIVVTLVAVLVASVVAMVKQSSKKKAKVYRQLQDMNLEDRTQTRIPEI